MKVIYGIGKAERIYRNAVLAIGVFDGVHIGHQKLIRTAVDKAKANGGQAIVMTFDPHPVKVLRPEIYLPYIVSLQQRLSLIGDLGVDISIVVNFTKRFADLSPDQFIENYLVKHIQPKEVIVGDEFCFGKERQGDIEYFKTAGEQNGFVVSPMASVKGGQIKIGSTGIRKLISVGELSRAAKYLGRSVSVFGVVSKGDGRGKTLGYPTANIAVSDGVLPPIGVYAVYMDFFGQRLSAMANIGHRPSFKKNVKEVTLEVHLFDFDQDIYDQHVRIEFIKKIREEQEFSDRDLLIQQLEKDAIKSQKILST